jgi:rifampicin phosphotransferase
MSTASSRWTQRAAPRGPCWPPSVRRPGVTPVRYGVISSEAEFDRIRNGDVLVCPATSPVWSVLIPSVGALVTDTGGILSHRAIIAREFRVPAVVATRVGTSQLHYGQVVTVDGTTGTVEVLR